MTTISATHRYAWGIDIAAYGSLGTSTTAAWPTANLALFIPLTLPSTFTVKQMFYTRGATGGGNIDIGIYSETGTRLVSTGSTATAGVAGITTIDVTDTTLARGRYYLAFAHDGTTATFRRYTTTAATWLAVAGGAQMAAAFPLPTTVTLALQTTNYIPEFGFTTRTEAV